ncbi:hypothetical protein FKV23_15245 [Lysobacter alkalisoli]|uniref:Lipoprotein n=2 Tax=Marilutibacter alkalisoli TaxID=2591633 RepID=A0A514BY39_9GAMM|nr:hypothetical protein [Lysobacter alkalisoli]QDH71909.1 hypothetical protein FKV23_15245 [Lysobacter alkalisoli]
MHLPYWPIAILLALLAACQPQPPEKERPPVPKTAGATELRDAIQAPLDKARAAEQAVQDAAKAREAAIDGD